MDTSLVATKALSRALDLLHALKADFIVKLPDGEPIVHGSLQLAPTKPTKGKRAAPSAPYGTYTALCRAKGVHTLQVGEVLAFSTDNLNPERVRAVACSLAGKTFGNESVMTSVSGNIVEVMRIK